MDFFKQIFRYLIVNIVMFVAYYILNMLFGGIKGLVEIPNSAVVFDIIISVITWIGFAALHVVRIADRKGYGIHYLYKNEKNPASPLSAFNIFTDWRRGNWETLAYLVMAFIPLTVYANAGEIIVGHNPIVAEIFLPQTVFFKLTGSPALGFVITVAAFYLLTTLVLINRRKVWLKTPLSDEERMLVDPDWQPVEPLPEEDVSSLEDKKEKE